ncbi:hypothetical protein [Ornithinimicrobium cerasi]|uniref:hypothetical protein n=1 Tax=Ornithinimicrobium cerasi TaxID=2248773 RepID=UPI000F0077E8|nr:hypothetical protein [Ornithinimicrobium cerasi]
MTSEDEAPVDIAVRIEFAHAALQHLADTYGIDLLHVKGIAFEPKWRSRAEGGSDADILVRPSQVRDFTRHLRRQGWTRRSSFRTGSASGHAETYWHDHLGYADVHRFFMGMGRDEGTFDALWSRRQITELAGVQCPVPDGVAQALIFAINEARNSPGLKQPERVGLSIDHQLAVQIEKLIPTVQAQVGWAAARGALDEVRAHREHDLWRTTRAPSGRLAEWRARVKAEPATLDKIVTVLRAPLVNTEHLANTRGHRPSPLEVAVEFVDRGRRAATEVWRTYRNGRGLG